MIPFDLMNLMFVDILVTVAFWPCASVMRDPLCLPLPPIRRSGMVISHRRGMPEQQHLIDHGCKGGARGRWCSVEPYT